MRNISTIRTALYCFVATILNLMLCDIVMLKLGLPLFCDTVFSIAILFYFGFAHAICVQLAFNILMIFGPYYLETGTLVFAQIVYSFSGAAAIYSTWLFTRKRSKLRQDYVSVALYLILTSIFSAFVTSIAGGIANFILLISTPVLKAHSNVEKIIYSFYSLKLTAFVSTILGRIPIMTLDRLIATFAGFGCFKLLCLYDKRKNEKKLNF